MLFYLSHTSVSLAGKPVLVIRLGFSLISSCSSIRIPDIDFGPYTRLVIAMAEAVRLHTPSTLASSQTAGLHRFCQSLGRLA